MTLNWTNAHSYRTSGGPPSFEIEAAVPKFRKETSRGLIWFYIEVYDENGLTGHSEINCKVEAVAHYKNSIWILFLRVKGGDTRFAGSAEHRYMTVAYDIDDRSGPVRFGPRSFLDFPIITGAEKAGSFIA